MRGCRVPYGPSRGTVTRMVSRAVWPVAGYGDEDGVACRIARRRIACGIARRLMASRPVPARVGDQCVPAMPTVRMPGGHTPMSPSAEPRLARTDLPSSVSECGKTGDPHRPCRTVTTAHRSTPGIVRASSGHRPGRTGHHGAAAPPGRRAECAKRRDIKPEKMRGDITGHHRSSSDIIGHHRVREGRRVPYRPSRGTATKDGRRVPYRVPYRPSPDHVSARARRHGVVSCAVSPVARWRRVASRPTSATSRPCRACGLANGTPVVCHAPAQQRL